MKGAVPQLLPDGGTCLHYKWCQMSDVSEEQREHVDYIKTYMKVPNLGV